MADEVWGFDRDRAEKLKKIADQTVPINSVNLPGRKRPSAIGGLGILFTTRTGGIAARTTTSRPHVFPHATCDLIDPSTGDHYSPNREVEVYNSTKIAINHVVDMVRQGKVTAEGLYFIDVDDC